MTKARFFESGEGFRAWLEERHASESELLLGFYKKELARGISYAEALDAALAFGWIDGVRKRLNAEAYTIRFTPRKARSIWSAVNIKRAKELEAAGRMAPAGLRAFHERDEKRAKLYSYERAAAKLDPGLAAKLRANRNAAEFFDAQPPGYKRLMSFWVMSAKKEETRERRLSALIAKSAKGKHIDMLKPKSALGDSAQWNSERIINAELLWSYRFPPFFPPRHDRSPVGRWRSAVTSEQLRPALVRATR